MFCITIGRNPLEGAAAFTVWTKPLSKLVFWTPMYSDP